jgi:hypothetical protein
MGVNSKLNLTSFLIYFLEMNSNPNTILTCQSSNELIAVAGAKVPLYTLFNTFKRLFLILFSALF